MNIDDVANNVKVLEESMGASMQHHNSKFDQLVQVIRSMQQGGSSSNGGSGQVQGNK